MKLTPILLAAVAITAAGLVTAGPLSPPAGPVASSYKTLAEVEPRIAINAANTPGDGSTTFRITQPGSYYLSGNLQGTPGQHVITVAASHVTIDFRGHTITGGICGILMAGQSQTGIVVRNGTISGCTGVGVNLVNCTGVVVEDIVADHISSAAVHGGDSSLVRRCIASSCGYGFYNAGNSCFEDCIATACTNEGFYGGGPAMTFTRCTAKACTGPGFLLNSIASGIADSCIADSNGLQGFRTTTSFRFVNCRALSNQDNGFEIGPGGAADRCDAQSNLGEGFHLTDDSAVTDCTARSNTLQGIHAIGSANSILRCRVLRSPGGLAGIWIEGARNIAEENTAEFNGYGIWCDSTDNVLTRNRCGGNSVDYHIVVGNEYAPIITNPGSNSFATMTPWSNISY